MRPHLVVYIENHDERRVASPIVTGQGPGASGFGSAEAGYQLAPLPLLAGNGPAMILNGQEVGEPGAGSEGFGGEDGRTTIYDYWAMPEFAKWVNGHAYDGADLSPSQKALRRFYGDLLRLCQHASVRGDSYWSLRYFNHPDRFADCPSGLYSFARFQSSSGQALVVATNFSPGSGIDSRLRIPRELSAAVHFPQNVIIELVLNREGATSAVVGTVAPDELESSGFRISIPNQTSQVYLLRPSQP
jgi:hypothetical protein